MKPARSMRAMVVERPGPAASRPLRLVQLPVPTPGPGEILVKVLACGVCRTDLHVVEGELARRDAGRGAFGRPGVIPGHQIVGEVVARGPGVTTPDESSRVGLAWLHHTCGSCEFCRDDRENLCDAAGFTGWSEPGGYAEYAIGRADFAYPLPTGFVDGRLAPLLCAGIIGWRCLRATGRFTLDGAVTGTRLGLYGFGAAGHIAIQLARAMGARVFVCTRDRERHRALATELGATWVGGVVDPPPEPLDAAIVFAPAGEIVPAALAALAKGGTLVLGGIHMSDIPALPYRLLYGERVVRSVANNTRTDGRELLAAIGRWPVETHCEPFALEQANDALIALRNDAIRGAAVIVPSLPAPPVPRE